MNRVIMLLMVAFAMPMMTGCGAKQRVKSLEAEILRCREKKATLSENVQEPADTTVAAVTPAEAE